MTMILKKHTKIVRCLHIDLKTVDLNHVVKGGRGQRGGLGWRVSLVLSLYDVLWFANVQAMLCSLQIHL